MSKSIEAKVVVTEVEGELVATATSQSLAAGFIGGITSIFSTSEAHVGSGAMAGKVAALVGAVYGTAYLKDGEFRFNPFA